jgi:hypothetical protein
MSSRFAGTDDAANRFCAFVLDTWKRVNNHQRYSPDTADRLPPIALGMWIGLRCVQRIIEHPDRRLERQAMFSAITPRFVRIPNPAHGPHRL